MRIKTARVIRLRPNQFRAAENIAWKVEVISDCGYGGAGIAPRISDAMLLAINNLLLAIELQRKD